MSLRLKSRQQSPPGGFLYEQKVTGWKSWVANPSSQWDFNLLCATLQQHRLANRRLGLDTNIRNIEAEVDAANAARVAGIPGADIYLAPGAIAPPKMSPPQNSPAVVAGASQLKKMAAGVANLIEWLKDGGVSVWPATAAGRAEVCAVCPKNGTGSLTKWFTVPASRLIQRQLEARKDLKLSTPFDDKLGVCDACLCSMTLKVHEPLDYIAKHTSDSVKAELDTKCWIISELNAIPSASHPAGS